MMISKRCWFNNLFGDLKKVSGIHTLLRSVIVRYLTCQSYVHVISFLLGHNTSLCFIFVDASLLDLPTNVVELEPETDWQQSNNVEGSLCNMISLCSPRTKWLNVTKPLFITWWWWFLSSWWWWWLRWSSIQGEEYTDWRGEASLTTHSNVAKF